MADNIAVTEGSGKTVATDDVGGVQYQRVKLDIGGDGASSPVTSIAKETGGNLDTIAGDTTSLDSKISACNTADVTISGSVLPTGAATSAKQPALGTAGTASSDVITVQGIANMTALSVTEASAGAIKTAVEIIDNAISGNEMQVDVVGSLPAGTNSIGQVQPSKYPTTDDAEYMNKYYTSAGAATDGIVWSPASGKRWYVTDLIVSVSAATTVTLEDDKAGGDAVVLKVDLAANGGFCKRFVTPLASGEDAADLIVTTTAGNLYITATGYEV